MAERFEAHVANLIQLMSIESGKVVPEATFEVAMAASGLRYYGALVLTEYGRGAEWEPGHFSLLVANNRCRWHQRPVERTGSPDDSLARPALAAGCTTVVKMPGNAELRQLPSAGNGLRS